MATAKENLRLNVTTKGAEGASKSMLSLKNAIIGVAGAYVGLKGAQAALSGLKNVSKAFQVQENSLIDLRNALKLNKKEWKSHFVELKTYASELQKITVHGDETTMQTMTMALNMGVATDKIKEATRGAMGLSQVFKMDLNTSMKYVALAMQGEYTMLRRYIPALRGAKTEAEQMAIVQKTLSDGFEMAKGQTESVSGKIQQMKNAWGDLKEVMGGFSTTLIPLFDTMKTFFASDLAKSWAKNFASVIKGIIQGVASLVEAISGLKLNLFGEKKQKSGIDVQKEAKSYSWSGNEAGKSKAIKTLEALKKGRLKGNTASNIIEKLASQEFEEANQLIKDNLKSSAEVKDKKKEKGIIEKITKQFDKIKKDYNAFVKPILKEAWSLFKKLQPLISPSLKFLSKFTDGLRVVAWAMQPVIDGLKGLATFLGFATEEAEKEAKANKKNTREGLGGLMESAFANRGGQKLGDVKRQTQRTVGSVYNTNEQGFLKKMLELSINQFGKKEGQGGQKTLMSEFGFPIDMIDSLKELKQIADYSFPAGEVKINPTVLTMSVEKGDSAPLDQGEKQGESEEADTGKDSGLENVKKEKKKKATKDEAVGLIKEVLDEVLFDKQDIKELQADVRQLQAQAG